MFCSTVDRFVKHRITSLNHFAALNTSVLQFCLLCFVCFSLLAPVHMCPFYFTSPLFKLTIFSSFVQSPLLFPNASQNHTAKGRTNIELREQFILADGVSQTMTAFRPKPSASSPISGSSASSLRTPAGPITKVYLQHTPRTSSLYVHLIIGIEKHVRMYHLRVDDRYRMN